MKQGSGNTGAAWKGTVWHTQVEFTYTGGRRYFLRTLLWSTRSEHIVVTVDGQVDGLGDPIEFAFTYDAGTGEVTVTDALIGWMERLNGLLL